MTAQLAQPTKFAGQVCLFIHTCICVHIYVYINFEPPWSCASCLTIDQDLNGRSLPQLMAAVAQSLNENKPVLPGHVFVGMIMQDVQRIVERYQADMVSHLSLFTLIRRSIDQSINHLIHLTCGLIVIHHVYILLPMVHLVCCWCCCTGQDKSRQRGHPRIVLTPRDCDAIRAGRHELFY
jgi:hypothetical protein